MYFLQRITCRICLQKLADYINVVMIYLLAAPISEKNKKVKYGNALIFVVEKKNNNKAVSSVSIVRRYNLDVVLRNSMF